MKLEINNLKFSYYSDKIILQDININIENCKKLVIVGVSGSGKTTLLKIISGILSNNSGNIAGRVLIDGQEPRDFNKNCETSYMFQEPTLLQNLTVRKNIELPLHIKKIIDKIISHPENYIQILDEKPDQYSVKNISIKLVDKLIQLVGLSNYQNFYPNELSGGMKTRTALARTFITKPRLLLLDEPFSSLDINWKYNLYLDLYKLVEIYDSTLIHVCHDIIEALTLANHIIILGTQGTIIGELIIEKKLPRTPNDIINNFKTEYNFIYSKLLQEKVRTITHD